MAKMQLTLLGRALAVALTLAASAAAADPPHARAAEADGKTFRDWRLDCGAAGCAVRTELRGGDGSLILTVMAEKSEDLGLLRLGTPLPLHLPDGAALALGDAPLRWIEWRTCGPMAWCEATVALDAHLLADLRRERSTEVVLTLVDGVRIRLTASLLGFSAAWGALGAYSDAGN